MPWGLNSQYCIWSEGGRDGERTKIHDVVAADGTVVDDNVPSPEGDGVPLYQGREPMSSPESQLQVLAMLTFLTSKRFFASASEPFFLPTGGASVISTSAMVGRGRMERLGGLVGRGVLLRVASAEAK